MKWSLPDTRGWALLGLFALTGYILHLVASDPKLASNTLFVTLATMVVGAGGLLNALGFFFGSSQSSSKKDETIATMATNASPSSPQPPGPTPP